MTQSVHTFARRALWLLPVWAALLFFSTLTHQPDPQTDFAGFAAYITTDIFLVSHLVGSIAGAALGSIGAGRLFPRWAGWLYALSTAGFALSFIILPVGMSIFSALLTLATAAMAYTAARTARRQLTQPAIASTT